MRSTLFTASLVAAGSALAQDSGNPQSARYSDSSTGISFMGFADGTGYQFGIALPQNPSRDFIVQLVSPLTNGAGWAGVDFGAAMNGPLLLVAWPNGRDVVVAPRIASGYKVPDTVPYAARALNLAPIGKGTFVNGTHVSATFVCGGCIGADAFAAADSKATFAFAYSSKAVQEPSNPNSLLSTHVSAGEPYGSFDVSLSSAQSPNYAAWAALVNQKGNAPPTSDGSQGPGSQNAGTGSTPVPASTSAPAPGGSNSDDGEEDDDYWKLSSTAIGAMVLVGVVYMLQMVSSLR